MNALAAFAGVLAWVTASAAPAAGLGEAAAGNVYCLVRPERSLTIVATDSAGFASDASQSFQIVEDSLADATIRADDLFKLIRQSDGRLRMTQRRDGAIVQTAILNVDSLGLWARGPTLSPVGGEFVIYRMLDAGSAGQRPCRREGAAKTCRRMHFEYFRDGDSRQDSHRPLLGVNVRELAAAQCESGPQQSDDGDGDLGPP